MSAQLQQVQTARAAEQVTTVDLCQSVSRAGVSGIIGAIRRGEMKGVSPKMISIRESVRKQDVIPKLDALERRHQECYRQAVASKEPEFDSARVYPQILKKPDLAEVLLDPIV